VTPGNGYVLTKLAGGGQWNDALATNKVAGFLMQSNLTLTVTFGGCNETDLTITTRLRATVEQQRVHCELGR